MRKILKDQKFRSAVWLSILICCTPLLFPVVSAADESYEGYLGDTIDLAGYSNTGTSVYLFMTGPGLPENGVTLTDTTQRADRGQFTIVDLDTNQQWSFKWNTQRIKSEIDPGTYTVYVTTEPVDKAHLGSPSSYQTLSVYLRDPGISQGSSSSEGMYTLNPEREVSTVPTTQRSVNTTTVSTPTQTLTITTQQTIPPTILATTMRAGQLPGIAIIAALGCAGFVAYSRKRNQ